MRHQSLLERGARVGREGGGGRAEPIAGQQSSETERLGARAVQIEGQNRDDFQGTVQKNTPKRAAGVFL